MRRRNRMSFTRVRGIGSPDSMYVKLRWSSQILFNPAATSATRAFVGNGMFDPDTGGGSSQPTGFDQYSALYGEYQVTGSAFRISFANILQGPAIAMVAAQLSTSIPLLEDLEGNPYASTRMIPGHGGTPGKTISRFMRTKKIIGRNTQSVNYAAATGANPNNKWYWVLRIAQADAVTFVEMYTNITITYYVKFWHRNILTDA